MANGRIVVPDLPAPEPLRPHPLQSDTFIQAAAPPIDNRLASLADALGSFNKNLAKFAAGQEAQNKELERAHKEMLTGRLAAYQAATSEDNQWRDINDGTQAWMRDPLIRDRVDTVYGNLAAREVAKEIDAEVRDGKINLLDPTFSIDGYIRGKAGERVKDIMLRSPHAAVAFQRGLEGVTKNLAGIQSQYVNGQMLQGLKDAYYNELRDAFVRGVMDSNGDPEVVMANVRATMEGGGPRRNKNGKLAGVYGIPHSDGDKILLAVLKDAVKDERTADAAIQILNMERPAVDGTKNVLPPLAKVYDHRNEVQAIYEKYDTVKKEAAKQRITEGFTLDALARLQAADGSFSLITDQQIPLDEQGREMFTVKADELKKTAIRMYVDGVRQKAMQDSPELRKMLGGDPYRVPILPDTFDAEYKAIVRNGQSHPLWKSYLEETVEGAATDLTSRQSMTRLQDAYKIYQTLNNRNPGWVTQNISPKARMVYDLYEVQLNQMQRSPGQAAAAISAVLSTDEGKADPEVKKKQDEINSAVIKVGGWWTGKNNDGDIREQVIKLATVYSKLSGVSAEKAVDWAGKTIKERSIEINGRHIFGHPEITKEDVPAIQAELGRIFKAYEAGLRKTKSKDGWFFDSYITGPKDLSIYPQKDGGIHVIDSQSGLWLTDPITDEAIILRPEDIRAATKKAEEDRLMGIIQQNAQPPPKKRRTMPRELFYNPNP